MTENLQHDAWRVEYGVRNHVIPNNDLVEHVRSIDCWCVPVEDGIAVVHNSADGREQFERDHYSAHRLPPPRRMD